MKKVFAFIFLLVTITHSDFSKAAFNNFLDSDSTLIAKNVNYYKVDRLGNVYYVDSKNTLNKFEPSINRYTKYADLRNGEITTIDVSNPLRIVVFYESQSVVKFLDINLTEINSFQIRNNYSEGWVSLVSGSNNNGLWMYDNVNRKLIKIGEQFNTQFSSGDLYLLLSKRINPISLFENSDELFLCDSTQGIFVFDLFGGYKKTIQYSTENTKLLSNSKHSTSRFNCELRNANELYIFPVFGK